MSLVTNWITKLPRLKNAKVARFSYKAEAYANDDIEGVENYDYSRDMNVPLATHTDFDPAVLSIGARTHFSSVTKNGLNHFFGRVSYNLNKVLDFLVDFLTDFIALNDSFISFTEIVSFSSSATLSNYENGTTKRLLNTAGSTITITLPAGETYLGSNTITLAPSIMLTITKRGTVWVNSSGTAITALTADKWKAARNITISDADGTNKGTAVSVDGSENETLKLPSTIKASLSGNVTGNVTGNVSGNAGTATKLATARTINGVSFDGSANITVADSTKAPTSHASSAVTYGVSSEANYGHAKASAVAGSANGTASKGTTPTVFAQSNHVHPLQTSVSGNAATADKWKTARNVSISDADGTNTGTAVSVDGSENETLKLPATIKATLSGNASKANVRVSLRHGNHFFAKAWTGLTNFSGSQVWTDGENIYYSFNATQYVLNKATSTWSVKTWTGLTNFLGYFIWTDGENIYYSFNATQYVLNKATSTWSVKTWTGLTNFIGEHIWTDGENIYYSRETEQYVLNKATSTWSVKTWTGLTNFTSYCVWTDGENIYYSRETEQYVLNKATSTWSVKTWTGLTNFIGEHIWTDGENIYYSRETEQYVLNKATSTWSVKTWTGLTNFTSYRVWTDGDNIYYSNSGTQHVLLATRHNYVDDDKYNSLFGTVVNCMCDTLSARFVFRNE